MEKKQWLITTALIALILPAIIMGFNYYMDPLWCFNISHKYNQVQAEINERKQKTNYITFRDFNYRGLLIGSSRSAFISQYSFKGLSVYNYSVNGFRMDELFPFTEYAKKRNGRDFEYIFLGLDFENAARYAIDEATLAVTKQNFDETNSLLYRVKTLLSIDTARYSWQNLKNYRKGFWRYYDRNNVEHIKKHTREEQLGIFTMHMTEYADKKKSRYLNFTYNENYKADLEKFKMENPRSRIVVFLTPASLPLLEMIVAYGLLDDYFRWIGDVVDVFGQVYLFMYPNRISEDYLDNFFDPSHANPEVGIMIVDAIYNKPITGDTDFGMLITRSNLKEKLQLLERLMKNARDPCFEPLIKK
ncbi:MAG TPA: hypothetical protein PLM53_09025 [Spirochaetota bacterium]|nr:hypothetical protein [Spirochaetota bacterium]HPC40131.1 hypothetical protein [Spirochaetota bacterium]HPL15821.1 hypothetical protein [Spirochaetota bacterium]HQF08535.1 hypothetical protein [Spirochaetota bacterium]HQH97228.1 hypothetical protein [Spirochaetota bacterium]